MNKETPFLSYISYFTISCFTAALLVMVDGCSSSSKISNKNLAYLYSPGTNFIHPDYKLVNIGPDTSRLFFRIPGDDLLYMKSDSGDFFTSSFSVSVKLLYSVESKEVIDTAIMYYSGTRVEDSVSFISDHLDFAASQGSDYFVQVTVTDHHRSQAVSGFLELDRTGLQSPDNFLIYDRTNGVPVLSDMVNDAVEIEILSTMTDSDSMWMRFYENRYPLPRPPFSGTDLKTISYHSDNAEKIRIGKGHLIKLDREGIYHFQFDTIQKEGLTVTRFSTDFPRITSASELIEPLRYLTTRDEYDRLRSARNKKDAIDKYWLDLSGNRERGRVLIRSYYSRVQFANRAFSSYLEGWKTDRGLIYIIFGPPSSVYLSADSESWNYGQMNSYSSLIFTFDKVNNPFTSKDFHLRRAEYYEVPWFRAVESWRSGRVVNDSY